MLNGFLTTALEIIIILDVCGAVVYVLAFSLRRASQKQAEQPVVASSTPGFTYGPTLNPALAGPSSVPPPLPEWAQEAVNRHGEPAPRPRVDVTVAIEINEGLVHGDFSFQIVNRIIDDDAVVVAQ